MPPRRESIPVGRCHGVALLLLASIAYAQDRPATAASGPPASQPVEFRTPDGARVLLLPQPSGPPLVHWAIASPCGPLVDPPGAPGLAAACAVASLAGTWRTGSLDRAREQKALAALDAAEADLAAAPRTDGKLPADLVEKVAQLRGLADAVGDAPAFRRVLMGAPASDLAVEVRGSVAILSLTTVPFAVGAVAALLHERREDQALRGIRAKYEQTRDRAIAAWDLDPMAPLRAEALALAFPGSVLAGAGDRPPSGGITRALAEATWARTQHPSLTVHVLAGNFDPAAVEAALVAAFQSTSLPAAVPVPRATPREQPALRRAIVPGARHPAAVVGWPLHGDENRAALRCLAQWFAAGPDSWLGSELQRRGRRRIQVQVLAPLPAGEPEGLFAIEVADPGHGDPDLADEVLMLCQPRTKKQPRAGDLAAAHSVILAQWEQATARTTDLAQHFAAEMLLYPGSPVPPAPPIDVSVPQLPDMLQRIFDGQHVVVEWRNL